MFSNHDVIFIGSLTFESYNILCLFSGELSRRVIEEVFRSSFMRYAFITELFFCLIEQEANPVAASFITCDTGRSI